MSAVEKKTFIVHISSIYFFPASLVGKVLHSLDAEYHSCKIFNANPGQGKGKLITPNSQVYPLDQNDAHCLSGFRGLLKPQKALFKESLSCQSGVNFMRGARCLSNKTIVELAEGQNPYSSPE